MAPVEAAGGGAAVGGGGGMWTPPLPLPTRVTVDWVAVAVAEVGDGAVVAVFGGGGLVRCPMDEVGLILFLTGRGGACCSETLVTVVFGGEGGPGGAVGAGSAASGFLVVPGGEGDECMRAFFSSWCLRVVAADDGDSDHLSFFSFPTPMERERESIGNGNTMVELCSVEMALSVWRYLQEMNQTM